MSQTAIVAGGCFWGLESRFQKMAGVIDTDVGYTGGHLENPTYRQVCQDVTGHVEAVKIEFDPTVVTYQEILEAFFEYHDPTLCESNCISHSSQYGSAIFTLDDDQERIAEDVINQILTSDVFDCPVSTIIQPADIFYPAEEYHQDYYKKHNLLDVDETCGC